MSNLASHGKSVAKAFTWRATAGADTLLVAYLATGKLAAAVTIVGAEFFTKSFLYYLHERAWLLEPAKLKLVFKKKEKAYG